MGDKAEKRDVPFRCAEYGIAVWSGHGARATAPHLRPSSGANGAVFMRASVSMRPNRISCYGKEALASLALNSPGESQGLPALLS